LERRHIARVEISPEEARLSGCWQCIAVQRERIPLNPSQPRNCATGYYATSLAKDERSPQELSALIREHWSAIENGVHCRRDVSLGEDQCRVRNRIGAETLATLRNLAIAVYELAAEAGRTQASSLRNWMKGQTFSSAHAALRR
jgi:hypothetical protein